MNKSNGLSPLISIVIPVYNTASFLPKCVESIVGQDFDDYEIILVDDGSTDGSGELCERYASGELKIKCLHQENAGVSAARNNGLSKSQGRYVWFCDSDDTVVDGALQKIADIIADSFPAMIVFAVEQVNEKGERLGLIPAPLPSRGPEQGPLQCGDLLYPYSHVIRRSITKGEYFDESLALLEDRDFCYRIAWKAAGNSVVIDEPLYRYLITRETSAMNTLCVSRNVDASRVHADILRNEERLGHVMPAFGYFAGYSIGTLSLIARFGSRKGDYEFIRNRLLEYRHYIQLLRGSIKVKYLLAVNFPQVFNALTRLLGIVRGKRNAGSDVLIKERD